MKHKRYKSVVIVSILCKLYDIPYEQRKFCFTGRELKRSWLRYSYVFEKHPDMIEGLFKYMDEV